MQRIQGQNFSVKWRYYAALTCLLFPTIVYTTLYTSTMVSKRKKIGYGAAGTLFYMGYTKGVIDQYVATFPYTRFGLCNLLLLSIYLAYRFFKWVFFGSLRNSEVENLRDKILYTSHELALGLLMVRLTEPFDLNIALKYSALFLCVLLLKCFHYLSVDRVSGIFYLSLNKRDVNRTLLHLRFALGIVLMHYIDIRCIQWFRRELDRDTHNVLLYIFGFEIVTLYPYILSTSIAYVVQFREYLMQLRHGPHYVWSSKARILAAVDVCTNVTRLAMFIVFTSVFVERFSLPALNILPASYTCLRLVIGETRQLIGMQRNTIRMRKLSLSEPTEASLILTSGECIVCRESLSEHNVRMLSCEHSFHLDCLQHWLSRSSSCPLCRHEL